MPDQVVIQPLQPAHAREAAELHAEGQPGTFLTSLGPRFLRVLYREFVHLPSVYGFEAVADGQVVGMVTGTSDTGALFRELLRRAWLRLGLVVALRLVAHPRLIRRVWDTLHYPSQLHSAPGEGEALTMAVRLPYRKHGIGTELMLALLREARRRGLRGLWYTVDGANENALRFHRRLGAEFQRTEIMYGRQMVLLFNDLKVVADDGGASPAGQHGAGR